MIRNNLALIMTEQKRHVSELANQTKISRNSISAIMQNESKMIQLATINKLCQALHTSPTDFFEYVPFDFDYNFQLGERKLFSNSMQNGYGSSFFINIVQDDETLAKIELNGTTTYIENVSNMSMPFDLTLQVGVESDLDTLKYYLSQLSNSFITEIKDDILIFIMRAIADEISPDNGKLKSTDIWLDLKINFETSLESDLKMKFKN